MSYLSLALKIASSPGNGFILALLYTSFFVVVVESQMLCIGQKISLEEFEACGVLRVTIATTNLTSRPG